MTGMQSQLKHNVSAYVFCSSVKGLIVAFSFIAVIAQVSFSERVLQCKQL